MSAALLLNADYTPLTVIDWQRATLLILEGRVELVEVYVGRVLRTISRVYPWPAVVRLKRFAPVRVRLRFHRGNVLARDGYRCQYCGLRPRPGNGGRMHELTIDHVVPRAQARDGTVRLATGRRVPVTCWENVVAACVQCNLRKADRTPEQARMRLLSVPRVPTPIDVLRMNLHREEIPREWMDYLPLDAAWQATGVSKFDAL